MTATALFEVTSSPVVDAFTTLVRQLHAWRNQHAQRLAIAELLTMDRTRLDDMGLTVADIRQALESRVSVGRVLSSRRAERARAWSSAAAFVV